MPLSQAQQERRRRRMRGLAASDDRPTSYTPPDQPAVEVPDLTTAQALIDWVDAAASDEDHIVRAEAAAAANAERAKPWASVRKVTDSILG